MVNRLPRPALRPFVECLWEGDGGPGQGSGATHREHVLPTGRMHVVFRLSKDPLRVLDNGTGGDVLTIRDAVVGGARASFYRREAATPHCSVGAMLRPGTAEALFGVHADALSGRHTPLADLWGSQVSSVRERFVEAGSAAERLDFLESVLAARLSRVRGVHPAIAEALELMMTVPSVRDVVRSSGYSHRTFIRLFSRSVGLTPKAYLRVLRFQRALRRASASQRPSWVDIAALAGYSDQSHFNREFREFTGVSPTEYLRISPPFPNHVQVRTAQP